MKRFDVALWRSWPSLFPHEVTYAEAPSAFAAIESLMRQSGLRYVAYASARACDGSLVYRGYGVTLLLFEHPEMEEVDTWWVRS